MSETIPALLAQRRKDSASVEAVVADGSRVTYAELDDQSRALAGRLVAAGVGKDSRVGLVLPNGVDWAVVALAVTRVGAVLVPLSTLLRPPELLAQLRTASVTHLIVAPSFRGRAYPEELATVGVVAPAGRLAAVPSLRSVWVWPSLPEACVEAPVVDALEACVRTADDLVVLFTSGSRGAPKGVLHTHGGGLRAVAATLESRRIGPGERLYVPMPFFWTGGLGAGLLSALLAGATLLTEAIPSPEQTLRLLESERVTLFRGWPDQAERLGAHPAFAETDLSALGDASLPGILPVSRRPARGARPNVFGMTETFGPYSGAALDVDLPTEKRGSCGRPFAGVDVRIVDPSTGLVASAADEGEIRLRGPNLMRGLCGRERSEVFDADGWYRTGDLGVLDADGYLWYRGRLDDMVKIAGASVYPIEVEAALRSLPSVVEAAVTDVDAEGVRRVAALVVVTSDPMESSRELAESVKGRLSSFKVPTVWRVVGDAALVPRLASGKVDVTELRRLLTSDQH